MNTGDASSSAARMAEQAAAAVDTGELTCASLILAVRQALDGLATGEVLAVVSRDPSARLDLPAWCRMTGHSYLETEDRDDHAIHYLRK